MEPNYSLNKTDTVARDKNLCNGSTSNVSGEAMVNSLLLCVFVGTLSVLITCGNLLVIISIVYFKQLHTPTNYLILSLAVADLLVGVVVLPFSTLLSVSSCWYLAGSLCNIRGAFDVFLCTSSILNLCCISVDRYYMVCHPLIYRTKINVRVSAIMILVSWAAAGLPASAVIGLRASKSFSDTRCKIFQSTKYSVIGVVFSSYIPVLVILTMYIRIFIVALKQANSVKNGKKSGAGVSKMELKATKTLAIVVGIYLTCWCPYFFCVIAVSQFRETMPVPMIEAFKWLGWSNSLFNPFVYGFFYKWFRSAFKLIISGKIFQDDFSNTKLL